MVYDDGTFSYINTHPGVHCGAFWRMIHRLEPKWRPMHDLQRLQTLIRTVRSQPRRSTDRHNLRRSDAVLQAIGGARP